MFSNHHFNYWDVLKNLTTTTILIVQYFTYFLMVVPVLNAHWNRFSCNFYVPITKYSNMQVFH